MYKDIFKEELSKNNQFEGILSLRSSNKKIIEAVEDKKFSLKSNW